MTSKETAESLACSDTESMGEDDGNDIDDIGQLEISGSIAYS